MTIPRWLGAAAPGLIGSTSGLDQMASVVGQVPGVANWYESWSPNSWTRGRRFADIIPAVDAVVARGSVPQVTWEPWDPSLGSLQPTYTLAMIANGAHDAYIDAWAADIKAWGKQLRIRPMHEMNRAGYPWSVGVNGNTGAAYIAAWRHIRSRFYRADVTNVWWSWCAQNVYPGLAPLSSVFPGDAYVDEVSFDGYNWALNGQGWNSFRGVFGQSIAAASTLTAKPITIGETGCPELGGDKAEWIRRMWGDLAGWPQVRGVLWFNIAKEADWRVDSSPASLTAFKAGLPGFLAS